MTVLLLWLLLGPTAIADDPLVAARKAQRSGDPAAEHAACQRVLRNSRSSSGTRACTRRLDWLEERRDRDGSWTSLDLLERARRGSPDRAGLEARAVQDTTAPNVATEISIWLARADLQTGSLEAARARTTTLWTAVADHPGAHQRRQIAALHAQVLARSGALSEAQAVEGLFSDRRSANPREGVVQERRMTAWRRIRTGSWCLCGLGLALGAVPAWRARQERGRFDGLAPLWVVGLGLGSLAWWRDPGTAGVTLGLVGVLTLHFLFSAHALRGARPGLPRSLLRVLLGGSALGVSVLVLERYGFLLQLLG